MFEKVKQFWDDHGMEFLVVVSFIVIIICFFINYWYGYKGTYTLPRYIDNPPEDTYIDTSDDGGFTSKLEWKSKIILESIFKRPFVRVRPDFLANPVTGKNLEIDLYNEELKLGFEINGDQHYRFIPYFQKNHEAFRNQQYRDEIKKMKCAQQGITLIEIPYKVGEKNLKEYIVKQLRLENYLL
jgi:hypothetical protein